MDDVTKENMLHYYHDRARDVHEHTTTYNADRTMAHRSAVFYETTKTLMRRRGSSELSHTRGRGASAAAAHSLHAPQGGGQDGLLPAADYR